MKLALLLGLLPLAACDPPPSSPPRPSQPDLASRLPTPVCDFDPQRGCPSGQFCLPDLGHDNPDYFRVCTTSRIEVRGCYDPSDRLTYACDGEVDTTQIGGCIHRLCPPASKSITLKTSRRGGYEEPKLYVSAVKFSGAWVEQTLTAGQTLSLE